MKKIYFLSSCSTCAKIILELQISSKTFEMQDIKTAKITLDQLNVMGKLAGNFESLFSRVALKYKALKKKPSTEEEYKKLIFEEYTFLKRPVILLNDKIFIGNSKNTIALAKKEIER